MRRILRNLCHRQDGFTLIELLVVVAILGCLAGIVAPNVGSFINHGKDEAMKVEFRNVQTAMTAGMIDNGLTAVSQS